MKHSHASHAEFKRSCEWQSGKKISAFCGELFGICNGKQVVVIPLNAFDAEFFNDSDCGLIVEIWTVHIDNISATKPVLDIVMRLQDREKILIMAMQVRDKSDSLDIVWNVNVEGNKLLLIFQKS